MMKLSDTTRLLLHSVQLNSTKKIRDAIESLVRQPIDWDAFEEYALWHGVAPLSFIGLRDIQDRQRLPVQLFETLKAEYRKNLIRNTILFSELENIVGAFGEQQIPIVLLKGAAITKMVYNDIGLRPMSDIDIVVKRKQVHQSVQAVEACGYRQYDWEDLEQLLNTRYHVVYRNPDTNILLEIHWDITSDHHPLLVRSYVSDLIEKWWSRVSNEATGFDHVFHLHPIDLICLLSLHFFKHRFIKQHACFSSKGAILQLCDIMNVICFYQDVITWDELRAESQKIGLYSIVSVSLWVVKAVFSEVISDCAAFFEKLDIDHCDKEIAVYAAKRICKMKDKYEPVPSEFVRADNTSSYLGRTAGVVNKFFPAPETLSKIVNKPINSNWFYLNYFTRSLFLLKRYGKTFFNRKYLKEEGILKRWINEID